MSKKTLENNGPKQDLQKATEQPQGEMASGPGNDASVGKGEEKEIPTCPPPPKEESKSVVKAYQEHEIQMVKLYDKYCEAVGGVSFNGNKLPSAEEFFADPNCSNPAHGWKEVAAHASALFVEAQGKVA